MSHKIAQNVKFGHVRHLIPQIHFQIWIFHAILIQGTMSKPIIFWFVAIYDANQRINKKGKKMASSLINLVICSWLLANMILIFVFRVMPVAYRPWANPQSTNLEKIFWCPEIWKFSSPSFRKPLCNGSQDIKGNSFW